MGIRSSASLLGDVTSDSILINSQIGAAYAAVKSVADNLVEIIALNTAYAATELRFKTERRIQRDTWGRGDTGAAFSVISGPTYQRQAEILGPGQPNHVLATYESRDAVTVYNEYMLPPLRISAVGTFTVNTFIPAAPLNVALLEVGMLIDTTHTPKFTGEIVSWNAAGTLVTVMQWHQMGNILDNQVPAGSATARFNPITKGWARNTNIFIMPTSYGNQAVCDEAGVFNFRGPVNFVTGENLSWGFDAVNLGTFEGGVGFIQRLNFRKGFVSSGASLYGFNVENSGQNPGASFISEATNNIGFVCAPAGVNHWQVGTDAVMKLGRHDGGPASASEFRFHSSGAAHTYDSRFRALAGSAAGGVGSGHMLFAGNRLVVCEANEANGIGITGGAVGVIKPEGVNATINMLLHAKGSNAIVQVGAAGGVVGFHGTGGAGQASLPNALAADGTATNATRDTLINAIRSVLNATGLTFAL